MADLVLVILGHSEFEVVHVHVGVGEVGSGRRRSGHGAEILWLVGGRGRGELLLSILVRVRNH